jgi:hypothetical protein
MTVVSDRPKPTITSPSPTGDLSKHAPARQPQHPQPALGSPDFWADELALTRNAYGFFEEMSDFDGMRSAFESVLDAAWGMVAERDPQCPLRAPWKNGDRDE